MRRGGNYFVENVVLNDMSQCDPLAKRKKVVMHFLKFFKIFFLFALTEVIQKFNFNFRSGLFMFEDFCLLEYIPC